MSLMEISVSVGKRHIKKANEYIARLLPMPSPKAAYSEICPVALALQERGYYAYVTRKTATVRRAKSGDLVGCYKLPLEAQNFIMEFDIYGDAAAISFVLDDVGDNDPPSAIEKERHEKDQNPEVKPASDSGHAEGRENQDIGHSDQGPDSSGRQD